jgi:CRP/FNR family transcriptional regulator, cyclic AMP receptor protein
MKVPVSTAQEPVPTNRPVVTGPIRLLDHEPDLAAALPGAQREIARRAAIARAERRRAGAWQPEAMLHACLCGVVLRGLAAREVSAAGTVSAQLFGPGDVIAATGAEDVGLVPATVSWFVIEPLVVAWLGEQFEQALRQWPALNRALFQRLSDASMRASFTQNLAQLTRVHDRVLVLLWHLAERFGRVTPDGVVVPLRLTHRMIARLVGARRPSVTTAIAALERTGTIERRADGAIVLHDRPGAALLRAVPSAAGPWSGRAGRDIVLDDLRMQWHQRATPTQADELSSAAP